ncbi:hypothetical protein [Cytobacillus sp.]|uniref:hypothetical protein n=1 Tax=Cytobacillus sp. TaxID=2675269 RepID=UPI0028BEABC1|nr:hypothetical protein [Cytobacillus sp.]
MNFLNEMYDTVAPYSEKLMFNHIVALISAAIGYLGAGVSVSKKRDLLLEYTRLMAEKNRNMK